MRNHDIFKSRRFWSAVMAVVVMLVYNYLPDLEVDPDMLTQGLLAVVGVLLGGYALEDVVIAAKSGSRASKYDSPQ
jgi:hypothetical protein